MKPLLLDLLACPICKYYHLKLDIFKWETSENKFSKVIKAFQKKDIEYLKNTTKIRRGKDITENGVIIDTQNDLILIRDVLVRKNLDIISYLEEIKPKLNYFNVIEDYTDENYSSCLNLIKTNIIKHIFDTKAKIVGQNINETPLEPQRQILDEIKADIYLLNWFFQFSEIEEGVMFCERCARWYPIIETIPQMLPDELRQYQNEIVFLKKWKSKLSKKIIENGKPFNLKTK
ncbi:MAG: Trm112 family protein [Promethearchaeota archaeon]